MSAAATFEIVATSSRTDSGTRVLKFDDAFAVFNRYGDIQQVGHGEQGLYFGGTRFLSRFALVLPSSRLLLLSSTVHENNLLLEVDLAVPELTRPDGTVAVGHASVHVHRSKFLYQGACHERLKITNYGGALVDLELGIEFAADFSDVFEVRGTHRERRGDFAPAARGRDEAILAYRGLDERERRTRLRFAPEPDALSAERASFALSLEPRQTRTLEVTIRCELDAPPAKLTPFEPAYRAACAKFREYDEDDCAIETSMEPFTAWFERSLADLRLLTTETNQGRFPYAGIPWFSTAFGRDGIITALEALWVTPELARGVLDFLAARQADRDDDQADAEPGKILHETRRGEMAALGEIPFGRYYGSVDATPLFVMLAGAYVEATDDREMLVRIWPHVERALAWIEQHGDQDGDGFVEYSRRSPNGLVQQGWKDSNDSVFYSDGALAKPPIALAEVQGYVYAAKRAAARLADCLGEEARARALRIEAEQLQERFDRAFWCDDLNTYALALDGRKRPCRVRTSNAGHALFTEIALPERAALLADQLLSPEMFSGFGVRTVASNEARYNPMAYHNGSVWPHDNALIADGLSRYGFTHHALRILSGMYEASTALDLHRLPELFCGFSRQPGRAPILYPVACSPQAWAAAAPFMMLRAATGLSVDAGQRRLTFARPTLPELLRTLRLRQLRVGAARLDVTLHRYPEDVGVSIDRREGEVVVFTMR